MRLIDRLVSQIDSDDDDGGDGADIGGGADADASGRCNGFSDSSGRFRDDENAADGSEDADRS